MWVYQNTIQIQLNYYWTTNPTTHPPRVRWSYIIERISSDQRGVHLRSSGLFISESVPFTCSVRSDPKIMLYDGMISAPKREYLTSPIKGNYRKSLKEIMPLYNLILGSGAIMFTQEMAKRLWRYWCGSLRGVSFLAGTLSWDVCVRVCVIMCFWSPWSQVTCHTASQDYLIWGHCYFVLFTFIL